MSPIAAAVAEHRDVKSSPVKLRDREHELDRMVSAAVWRRERAKAGQGFTFEIPESARRQSR